jgi:hypothetical protein
MGKLLLGVLFLCALSCTVKDNEQDLKQTQTTTKQSFLPENNYHELLNLQTGDLTEQEFNTILNVATRIYSPIIKRLGATLTVKGDFLDPTVNAYATTDGKKWEVRFFGGLAKHYLMNVPGFTLVVCHEISHLIGGYPFYSGSYLAVEGQSDFAATQVCARKMFQSEELRGLDHVIYDYCDSDKIENKETCNLSLDGGLSLGEVLASLSQEKLPTFETPSRVVAKRIMQNHPKAQCRLDSYKAGALCATVWNDAIIPKTRTQALKLSCPKPKCWFGI